MEIDRVRVAALITIVLIVLIFSKLIVEYNFTIFKYAEGNTVKLVANDTATIGQGVSRFLWNYRVIDLIAQAFVLVAAAASCVALLKVEERKN